jgi:hypothetical protein
LDAPLYRIAHVRSGDKGDVALLAVIAYSPELYPVLRDQLTDEVVAKAFGAALTGQVTRHEVPAIDALNFVLEGALGGGVSRSLSLDNYGKALCARSLSITLDVPEKLASLLRDR